MCRGLSVAKRAKSAAGGRGPEAGGERRGFEGRNPRESEKGTQTCKGYQQSACWELYIYQNAQIFFYAIETELVAAEVKFT